MRRKILKGISMGSKLEDCKRCNKVRVGFGLQIVEFIKSTHSPCWPEILCIVKYKDLIPTDDNLVIFFKAEFAMLETNNLTKHSN